MKEKHILSALMASLMGIVLILTMCNIHTADASEIMTEKPVISLLGHSYVLLAQYKQPDNAALDIEETYSSELSKLKSELGLEHLTAANSAQFVNAIENQSATSTGDYSDLMVALDILDNTKANKELSQILTLAAKQVMAKQMSEKDFQILLAMNLPIDPQNHNDFPTYQDRRIGSINIANARAYAKKYAYKANPKYSQFKNGDCANFASQIAFAGGIPMQVDANRGVGWWWRSTWNAGHSDSWTVADYFKRYFGSSYHTKNWRSFVNNINPGDFIGIDYGNDGKVDHVAFVYDKNATGLYIAQHTSNYLKWNGGWPNYNSKSTYYRINR